VFEPAFMGEPRASASGEPRQCVFAKLSSNLFVQDHTIEYRKRRRASPQTGTV